jgi:hypothetical protein
MSRQARAVKLSQRLNTRLRASDAAAPAPPPPPSIVTSGLVMHLDAGDAASYPGTGTAWTDLTGNGNTLTAINSPTWDSNGWFATGATGYFERASGTNIPQGNDPYTMQVWVRLPSWAPSQFNGIMQIGTAGVTNQSNGIRTFNQTVGHFNHFWWANDLNVSNNNASLSINVWFMLTVSFDLTTRKITANLTDVGSDTPGSGHNVTSSRLFVGRIDVGANGYLQGDVAIARIYNRALSAAEITQNFDAQKARFGL